MNSSGDYSTEDPFSERRARRYLTGGSMSGPFSGTGMIVFRALGSTELNGQDGRELLSILARPKRCSSANS
jgi:hypothetical protein